jgi:tRNA threonylcarbamoyladenosine biosynthesis protein TsaB
MNVLAFDTCFGAVSVSLRWQAAPGEWRHCDLYEEMTSGQAERLMPMIAEAMRQAGQTFKDIDRIAVTRGPGSFTGVRVGVAAARALALATGRPVVTMTSLHVMALRAAASLEADGPREMVVAVDARRGGLYIQMFGQSGRDGMSEPMVATAEAAARLVGTQGVVVVGTGGPLIAEAAATRGLGPVAVQLPELQPHARFLALCAADLAPVSEVKPLYLRPPDAQVPISMALPRAE